VRLGEETARAFREASAKLKVETEAPMSTRTGG
jgi:hypothetical protein